jgi:hypothetical protein
MLAAGAAGGMVAMTRTAAGAATSLAGLTARAIGTALGGASGGAGKSGVVGPGIGEDGPSLGGAAKGAFVATSKALFRGAGSAVSHAAAPITDNFKMGMKVGRIDVEGPGSMAPPAWAATARQSLKNRTM